MLLLPEYARFHSVLLSFFLWLPVFPRKSTFRATVQLQLAASLIVIDDDDDGDGRSARPFPPPPALAHRGREAEEKYTADIRCSDDMPDQYSSVLTKQGFVYYDTGKVLKFTLYPMVTVARALANAGRRHGIFEWVCRPPSPLLTLAAAGLSLSMWAKWRWINSHF